MSPVINYPPYLQPQAAFQHLSVAQLVVQGRYLLRGLNRPLVYDQGGLIAVDCVCNPRERMLDLSVNLLGTFSVADGVWRVTASPPWQPGQTVQPPAVGQISSWQPYDWYTVAIGRIHQQPTSILASNQQLYCHVCHDPTHANYWHLVIGFATAQGQNVAGFPLSSGEKKRMLGDLRAWLRQCIGLNPQPQILPTGNASNVIPLPYCQHIQPDVCPV